MANDTCPHCGAAAKGPEHDWDHGCGMKTDFACGSSRVVFFARDSLSLWQSEECKDRELAALRNQLATVTAERDDWRDTAAAMMTAACGTDDIDEQERMCDANGTKPSQFVAALKAERDELRRRLDEAPVGFLMKYSTGRLGTEFHWSGHAASASAKKHGTSVARVRLVRDDQPTEDVPESSQRNP